MLRSVSIAIALAAAAACGRVGFELTDDGRLLADAAPDTIAACLGAPAHDEDGDGLGDECDPCPHLPGTATDADGDGVGDDCDLQPALPDRIAYFDPYTEAREDWDYDGATVGGDELAISGLPGSLLRLPGQAGPGMIGVGARIEPVTNFQQQLSLGYAIDQAGYFCELYWTEEGARYLAATYTLDGTNFTVAPVALPPVAASDVRLEMYSDGNRWRCVGEFLGVRYESPVVEVDFSGGVVELSANGLATQARYFIRIAPR